ncbi:MAG: TOBE domain-containing protein [Rhodobacteraceae bacterium]|nr:TOBE domain-containing protein [Paracoccaceae bacterium]
MRPEHMKVHTSSPDVPAIPARIVFSEMTGANLVLHCESDVGRLIVTAPRHDMTSGGETVWIGYDTDQAIYFDAASESRVEMA